MRRLLFFTFSICSVLALNSCDKIEGCMDENALNYDITAEVDKGCIYCDSEPPIMLTTFNDYLIENRFGFPFTGDSIMAISIQHQQQNFPYVQCGVSGCTFKIIATSLIDMRMQDMRIQFEVPVNGTFGSYFFQFNGNFIGIDLEPGESQDITSFFFTPATNACSEMVPTGFSFQSVFQGFYVE